MDNQEESTENLLLNDVPKPPNEVDGIPIPPKEKLSDVIPAARNMETVVLSVCVVGLIMLFVWLVLSISNNERSISLDTEKSTADAESQVIGETPLVEKTKPTPALSRKETNFTLIYKKFYPMRGSRYVDPPDLDDIVAYDIETGSKKVLYTVDELHSFIPGPNSLQPVNAIVTSKDDSTFSFFERQLSNKGPEPVSLKIFDAVGNDMSRETKGIYIKCFWGVPLTVIEVSETSAERVLQETQCAYKDFIYGLSRDEQFVYVTNFDEVYTLAIDSGEKRTLPIMHDELVFWNDLRIDLDKEIILTFRGGDLKRRPGNEKNIIEIRRLENTDFDYLTVNDVRKLEIIDRVEMATKGIYDAVLSFTGDGIFYSAVESTNQSNPQLGFYDINSKTNYFPFDLPNGEYHYTAPFAAIDAHNLFFTTRQDRQISLYKTSVENEPELVDSEYAGGFSALDIIYTNPDEATGRVDDGYRSPAEYAVNEVVLLPSARANEELSLELSVLEEGYLEISGQVDPSINLVTGSITDINGFRVALLSSDDKTVLYPQGGAWSGVNNKPLPYGTYSLGIAGPGDIPLGSFNFQYGPSQLDSTQVPDITMAVQYIQDEEVGREPTVYWRAKNAEYCEASGDWSGQKEIIGEEKIGPAVNRDEYKLTCYGPGGSNSDCTWRFDYDNEDDVRQFRKSRECPSSL